MIVTGPKAFEDFAFVKTTLDKLTFQLFNITLISNMEPGKEHTISPASFPQAEKWLNYRWRKNAVSGRDKTRYSTLVRYHAPGKGTKQWGEGVRQMRLDMIQDAQAVIAFLDVGGDDFHTEELVRLAKFYDLKLKVILV
jgi:hypothetical protein